MKRYTVNAAQDVVNYETNRDKSDDMLFTELSRKLVTSKVFLDCVFHLQAGTTSECGVFHE